MFVSFSWFYVKSGWLIFYDIVHVFNSWGLGYKRVEYYIKESEHAMGSEGEMLTSTLFLFLSLIFNCLSGIFRTPV